MAPVVNKKAWKIALHVKNENPGLQNLLIKFNFVSLRLGDVRAGRRHSEMVFDVELPAIDMGITFRDTGAKGPAVVESLKPGGAVQVERS